MREKITAMKRRCHQTLGLMLLAVVVFSGCSSEQAETVVPVAPQEPEPISLAFSSVSYSRANTRLADVVVQNTSYRSIEGFRFVSLVKDGRTITNVSDAEVDHPDWVSKSGSKFYHFSYCNMARGVNGCLVYARAKDEVQATDQETKVYNGSLNSYFPTYINSMYQLKRIYFEPESIYDDADKGEDGIHADAWKLANALTEIASIANWSNSTNDKLKHLFDSFINNGYDLPGSAASVRQWILALIDAVSTDGFNFGGGTIYEQTRQSILAKAREFLDSEKDDNILSMNYPQNIFLPDGAAVLRWAEVEGGSRKFVPQLRTTTLDDINSITRFVYPPALHYFVDSDIQTSTTSRNLGNYDTKNTWSGVLDAFFSNGGTIQNNTKTVAIAAPLQYAVAQLAFKVKAKESALKYAEGKTIDAEKLILKGVIIGGQRTVGYDFKPINNLDSDVKFVYDSQVNTGNNVLTTDYQTNNTLVLQSWDGEDLNVILEFEYTGDAEFLCLNGHVYPGTRLYLVGEVKASDFNIGTGDEDSKDRVFTQDYTTTIEMTVNSLEKAYNVLPSILAKNLEIGVMTTPQWKAATPSDPVILE